MTNSAEVQQRTALDSSIRVIDLSTNVAGPFCARLLADLGADVIKVEAPPGDSARQFFPIDPATGESALFEFLNWNKQGMVLDLETEAGREDFFGLLDDSCVVVHNFTPGYLDRLGLGFETLSAAFPGIILTSISPFGQYGPRSHWKHDEITDWAMGGYMYFGGHPDRSPLAVPGHQAELHAGQAAALATLAAALYRRASGVGQHIDQSIQEAVLSTHAWNSVAWTHEGVVIGRAGSGLIQCSDGWLMFQRRFFEESIFILIDRIDLLDEPRFKDDELWRDPTSEIWQLVGEWCMGQQMLQVYHAAQELRIPVTPVTTPADILASEQLAARRWLQTIEVTPGVARTFPGFPFNLSRTPPTLRHRAPIASQSTSQSSTSRVRAANQRVREVKDPAGTGPAGGPLTGLTVVEVTANWAGPLAGRHLADLGATVVKLEAPHRPATRMLWYAGGEPGKYPHNRSGYFNKLNRNKYGLSLDISRPEGREAFLKLIERSDVLIENNSPRVMPNLGLDYDTLSAINPRLIMASISGFGVNGPERDYVAYGANIEASCGLASVTGYGDGIPYRVGSFYADPIAANYSVIAILAALYEREDSGQGQFIDVALNECALTFTAEALLEYQIAGQVPHRGNRSPNRAPQGAYRCVGNDHWLALAVGDDDEWRSLCDVLGRPDWKTDDRLDTTEGRRAHHDEIDEAIQSWCDGMGHMEAATRLQAAGIPAAPVMKNWEFLSDVHLHQRDFYLPVAHAEVGVYPFPGMPWKLSKTPGSIRMAAPLFAEHNHHVLREFAGLHDDEVAVLAATGVTSDHPTVHSVIKRNT